MVAHSHRTGGFQPPLTRVFFHAAGIWDRFYFVWGRQLRATVTDASVEVSLIIRKRLPSGPTSQLNGPVRMPVSTISVWNRLRGVPAWKTELVATSIIFESGEM